MTQLKILLVLGASSLFGSTVTALAFSNTTSTSTSSATAGTITSATAPTNLCSTALYHINIHRQNHSAPLATYNQTSANIAESAISGCQAAMGVLPGETSAIFYGSGDNPYNAAQIISQSINLWYNEVGQYNTLTDGFTIAPNMGDPSYTSTLAFTQLVWKASTSVGCFAQACGAADPLTMSLKSGSQTWDWSWNILCDFYPGGNVNYANEFQENVGGPLGLPADDPTTNLDDSTCS